MAIAILAFPYILQIQIITPGILMVHLIEPEYTTYSMIQRISNKAIQPVLFAILLNLLFLCVVNADQSRFRIAENLQRLGAEAEQKRLPILLLISQYHCGYCERMKKEVLQPMKANKDFQGRILVRELMIDAGEKVVDFQGKQMGSAAFTQRYGVYVTPTLLFLDSRGEEAAERILGINTIDYLAFYIEDAIEKASKVASDPTS